MLIKYFIILINKKTGMHVREVPLLYQHANFEMNWFNTFKKNYKIFTFGLRDVWPFLNICFDLALTFKSTKHRMNLLS